MRRIRPELQLKFTGNSRESKIPKIKDLLIASSAIVNDKILITKDSDFEVFRKFGLKVEFL